MNFYPATGNTGVFSLHFQLPLFLSDLSTFSWVGAPWDMKNYFRGSSIEVRFVNSGVGYGL